MEPTRRGRRIAVIAAAAIALVAILAGVVAITSGSGNDLTVYTARSHYGEEQPFEDYEDRTGEGIELFGGSASELYERLTNERADTSADLLITVDAANLWRAKEDGLLAPVESATLERNVPAELRDPDNSFFGLTQRARTIMRSTERVPEAEAPDTYEALGDPQWRGRLCLRSGTSEYNVSFVADRLVKDGDEATEEMLRSWMANEPQILGSDVDVLDAIASGQCDIGLTNTYYLGRELEEDPDFPVAPVFADQDGRGTHVNLSGIGLVRWARHRTQAIGLMEFLTDPAQQETLASSNHEFAVAADVEPTQEIAQFGDFKRDPIDVADAGARLDDALALMSDVGWR